MSKLTELDLQLRWFWEKWPKTLLLPNYTPAGWFETDVFEYTAGGFFREIEIKLTKYDLAADTEKREHAYSLVRSGRWERENGEFKHERMFRGDPQGPAEFSYLLPLELAEESDVPDYAGLYGFEEVGEPEDHIRKRVAIRCVRRAKRLHSHKLSMEVVNHARMICYYRMHRLYFRLHRFRTKEDGERAEGDKGW